MRTWHTWMIFTVSLAIGLCAMGGVTATMLRLDANARRSDEEEETVRRALLRMQSSIQMLMARENAVPFLNYKPPVFGSAAPGMSCPTISPLERILHPEVRLHFQIDGEGNLSSPQVPENFPEVPAEETYATRLDELRNLVDPEQFADACPPTPATALAMAIDDRFTEYPDPRRLPTAGVEGRGGFAPKTRQDYDWRLRHIDMQRQQVALVELPTTDVQQDLMRAAWVNDELFLAQVRVGSEEIFQGCWLDWNVIKISLLGEIAELLPDADLEPVMRASASSFDPRELVGLPARLIPGELPRPAVHGLSPVQRTLIVAWASVVLAAVAVAVLLHGALRLSARRAAFVSAVTHELRTPLTSFPMYAEMLAEDMVAPEKRRTYLSRLRTEANRLGHLVENVLCFARLEKGRSLRLTHALPVAEIIEHARERLALHAEQAGMALVVDLDGTAEVAVRTDLAAAEQVLFNLVDNACKYARSAQDRRIHIEGRACGGHVALRIRDHGPGVSREIQRRLFRPFSKSEMDAANSAPGIGLGLSLCRQLARNLGGDLVHEPASGGASFVLRLPRA